jgi:Double zinc ribbon
VPRKFIFAPVVSLSCQVLPTWEPPDRNAPSTMSKFLATIDLSSPVTGVPAPEDTTGPATTTSASFPDPEPGPARAAPHEHGDDIASASEPTDPILAGSDSVSATPPPAAKDHESRTASFAREGHTSGRVSNPVISCPVCGTIHEEWTPFCETCGAAAPPATFPDADPSPVPAEQAAACSQCGHALRSTQRFCTSCGSPNQLAANQSTDQTDTADPANVSSTAASGAGSFERPPARGAPAGTGQQTWEQPQPAWAPPRTSVGCRTISQAWRHSRSSGAACPCHHALREMPESIGPTAHDGRFSSPLS